MITRTLDRPKSEAFAERLMATMNSAALTLMTSIGHRAGLFDTMSRLDFATSAEIAAEAGLNERYVREWLGAMATGAFVECDPAGPRFRLPPEHAAWLTREAAADNFAVFAQYIPLLGAVEDGILDCFRNGGGLPYSAYGRFHEVMAEDSGQSVLPMLIDAILPLRPGLIEALERGIDVLDVGCGRARALNLLARTYPRSRFTGYDLCEEAITAGREESRRHGIANLRLESRDLTGFEADAAFDLITAFDAIHDQAAPGAVLTGIVRALRRGGTFLMQDIAGSCHVHRNRDHPLGPLLYTVSCLHCMSVSLAQGGAGLGAMWGEETAVRMLEEAGFTRVKKYRLPHDVQNAYYVASLE